MVLGFGLLFNVGGSLGPWMSAWVFPQAEGGFPGCDGQGVGPVLWMVCGCPPPPLLPVLGWLLRCQCLCVLTCVSIACSAV